MPDFVNALLSNISRKLYCCFKTINISKALEYLEAAESTDAANTSNKTCRLDYLLLGEQDHKTNLAKILDLVKDISTDEKALLMTIPSLSHVGVFIVFTGSLIIYRLEKLKSWKPLSRLSWILEILRMMFSFRCSKLRTFPKITVPCFLYLRD